MTTAVQRRWWLPASPRRVRVTAGGLWLWRDASGRSAGLCPTDIHTGPGMLWFRIAGPGWRRAQGRRQPGRLSLVLRAGCMPADAWRRLSVALHWRMSQVDPPTTPAEHAAASPGRAARGRS